ncbi:C40 family peptidase [Paenibacillus sp. CF384]|uniref:C40 family peptidase n=1 Tax=Paenibacillus sp. CF384 TaxID=1884382 RepID=UPI000897AAEB|nr:SH3 domain-containing C40 family peptidase [Paenibacillus sp. CF384]SDX72020.1 Cell wall-associated hydrolase, NlpC family [Paenibacillus sp. CF384]
MSIKPILRKIMAVGLCTAIGFGAISIGQASLLPKASAATVYETKVTSGVNLRASASTSGRVIRLIPTGESIHVISQVNSYWLKVSDKRGNTGYVSANDKYTNHDASSSSGSSSSSSSKTDRVVDIARSYIGRVHYDFGTRNPSKLIFDCSSFTEFVFAKVGVDLKWGTKSQKNQGSYTNKSSLRKGDLVFFDTIGSNNKVINHVGISIGGGQFIHNTPSKDGLAINSLTSGYWSTHYVTARRVL